MINLMKYLTEEKIIIGFISAITLAFLFPPFESIHPNGGSSNAGYNFILSSPKEAWRRPIVDVDMLLVEWGFALIFATALWILIKTKSAKADHNNVIEKAEAEKLSLAQKYEDGEINFVELEKEKIKIDRNIFMRQKILFKIQE